MAKVGQCKIKTRESGIFYNSSVKTIFFHHGLTPDVMSHLSCLYSIVPEVEVKGESAHYFLLVQGSDNIGSGACRVRMLHSDSQINGAAAMATVFGLLREKSLSSSGILCYSVCRAVFVGVFVCVPL